MWLPLDTHIACYIIALRTARGTQKINLSKKKGECLEREQNILFSFSSFFEYQQMATTVMTTLPQFSGLRPQFSAAPVKNLVSIA